MRSQRSARLILSHPHSPQLYCTLSRSSAQLISSTACFRLRTRRSMGDHASGSSGARTSCATEDVKVSFALGLAGSCSGSGPAAGMAGGCSSFGGGSAIGSGVGVPGLPPLVPPPSFLHPPASGSAADYYYTACALGAAGLSTMAVLSGVNGSGAPLIQYTSTVLYNILLNTLIFYSNVFRSVRLQTTPTRNPRGRRRRLCPQVLHTFR